MRSKLLTGNVITLWALASAACGPSILGTDAGSEAIDASPAIDGPPDNDHDGYPDGIDCNDDNDQIHPGATEVCDDGVDNNCNGKTDTDLECLSPCERAEVEDSYFGCRFWAVDLPQFTTDKIYAISVSNHSDIDTAHVTISTAGGQVAAFDVPPKGVETYQDSGRAQNVSGSGIHNKAFLVESDFPVAAYQFNSFDTIGAASTDASLLFAEHSLATLYYSMDYSSRGADDSYIAIYATQPDTVVTIVPASPVAGATNATLQPYEVLLVSAQNSNTNLTGSQISATAPIGVFGGNRCTNVPYGMSYCDHLEQQIFPRQAIGTRYIVGKSHPRMHCTVEDYVRIMADDDATVIDFDPPSAFEPALATTTLDAGQWVELKMVGSVEMSSEKAFYVGQFLRSSNGDTDGCDDEGDPAFILQVPADQFRNDYVFLTPPTYQTDYVDVIAPIGATVLLDGNPMTLDAMPIGATNHTLTSTVIADGRHVIAASDPVGVVVYGYGGPDDASDTRNVSYGYPAGLDLNPINPVE